MKKFSFLLIASLLLAPIACEKVKKAQEPAVTAPAGGGTADALKQQEESGSISLANVILYPKDKDPITLTVEVARTADERRQGLQGRESLGDNHGMWFVFEEDVQDPFWMRDTPISLDILFVDKDYKIVDFVENAEPNSETLIVSRERYRYALEINGSALREYGLAVGDRLDFRLGPP